MPTTIDWTDETWNPVTGCTRVSPGCDHCYMFALYPRLKAMSVSGYESEPSEVQLQHQRLNAPLLWKKGKRIFVNSMSDLFHPKVPFTFVNEVFAVMQQASKQNGHIFQVLTKRPGRAVAWWQYHGRYLLSDWPSNVWIGCSVENQKYAPRLSVLAQLPAPIRFVSAEPLLDFIDLTPWLDQRVLQWVIVGGESGPQARAMDLQWARALRDQSIKARVPFFLKQLGGKRSKHAGEDATLDGRTWREFPS